MEYNLVYKNITIFLGIELLILDFLKVHLYVYSF